MSHQPKHPDSTPAELLERIVEVNSEGTEKERRQRAGVRDVVDMRVYVPRCKAPHSVDYEP